MRVTMRNSSILFLSLWTFFLFFNVVKSEQGYQQEIYLYEGDSLDANYHVFRDAIPDLSEWPFYNKKTITTVCARGAWIYYKEANFQGYIFGNYSHDRHPDGCHVKGSGTRFPFEESLSVRYIGSKHTSQEQVSFFTEEFFQGTEYSTDPVTKSISGITDEIKSVVFTGYSNWTFFEDVNFNGTDRCFENSISRRMGVTNATVIRPKDIDFYARDPLFQSRLLTVGSATNLCPCKTEEMGIPGARDFETSGDSYNDNYSKDINSDIELDEKIDGIAHDKHNDKENNFLKNPR